jgi:hypothetical protein
MHVNVCQTIWSTTILPGWPASRWSATSLANSSQPSLHHQID